MSVTTFQNQASLAYATEKPSLTAILKQEPEDFLVDEELGFEPTGSGDHLFLKVKKRNFSTTEIAAKLSNSLQIRLGDVSYAGMKDRRAVTTQWFSAKLPEKKEIKLKGLMDSHSTDIEIVDVQRNARKLKIGSHRGNSFQLRLKSVSGEREGLEKTLQYLDQEGFPNYFGTQRFGKDMSNLTQVLKLFDKSEFGAGRSRKKRTGMLYSAARSYLFNQILSERVSGNCWNKYIPGDVFSLDGTKRFFKVDAEDWDETLEQRLISLDIHPTGLLCGQQEKSDNYATQGQAADIEDAIVARYSSLAEGLKRHGLQAGRRPLRCNVTDLQWHWEDDHSLALNFTLPRGAYATSFLREICLVDAG